MIEMNINIRVEDNKVNLSSPEMDCDYWIKRNDLHGQIEALINEWLGMQEGRTCLECRNAQVWSEYGQTHYECKLAFTSKDVEFEEFYNSCLDKGYGAEDTAGLCHRFSPLGELPLEP
jgi:hypothetical protein